MDARMEPRPIAILLRTLIFTILAPGSVTVLIPSERCKLGNLAIRVP